MRHLRSAGRRWSAVGILAVAAALVIAGCASGTSDSRAADVYLSAPFGADETLQYRVLDLNAEAGEAVEIGHGTLSVTRSDGQLVLRQQFEGVSEDGSAANTDDASVTVDPDTFRPLAGSRTVVTQDGDNASTRSTRTYEWRYEEREDGPVLVVVEDGGERELKLHDHYYDNESSLWLWRSIDFEHPPGATASEATETGTTLPAEVEAEGDLYDAFYVSVNAMERKQQTVNLRIPQIETVTVPAGEFETYRLLFRNGRAVRTAWIELAPPHRVVRWDNGQSVLELLAD